VYYEVEDYRIELYISDTEDASGKRAVRRCVCVMLGLIVLYVRRKLVIDHAVGRSLAQAADTFSITA